MPSPRIGGTGADDPRPTGARILTRDFLRRSLSAAFLYLSIAAAVMAVACAFDWMDPLEDRVAESGDDPVDGTMAASWLPVR